MNLRLIQLEQREWATKNFGDKPSWHPLLGAVEELGELAHAFLKREQGIRGTTESHTEDIRDAIGDITIYLLDFCNREGLDLQSIIQDTWAEVKQRDWKANPLNGRRGHNEV